MFARSLAAEMLQIMSAAYEGQHNAGALDVKKVVGSKNGLEPISSVSVQFQCLTL